MLKKENRLKAGRLKSPTTFDLKLFNAKVSDNDLGIPRISFVISKKIDKRATVRNRIRRKLSAGIEEILKGKRVGKDIIFYPKKEVFEAEAKDTISELKAFINKV